MRKLGLLIFVSTFFTICTVNAQNLSVESIEIGTDVENREIVGVDTLFSNDVETVYCFTEVTGAEDTTTISHVWYYESEEKGRVNLEVRNENWRTWSSKKILPAWTGAWKVEVLGPNGELLASDSFEISENN